MRICAVIAEYNPFHSGHKYQLDYIKALGYDGCVVIMSTNFVQRGDAAMVPKRARSLAALGGGADLIIDLPCAFCTQSAEKFAESAVYLANSLGCVEALCFGSENNDTDKLYEIANLLLSEEFNLKLRESLGSGESFAVIRAKTAEAFIQGAAEILNTPNNILAVEYLKALIKLKSAIKPIALLRKGVHHHDNVPNENFASASFLRQNSGNLSLLSSFMPKGSFEIIDQYKKEGLILDRDKFEIAALSRLRLMQKSDFAKVHGCGEGLEHRVYQAVQSSCTLTEIYENVKSKRYTMAKIRRLILHSVLGIKHSIPQLPPYVHFYGANAVGLKIMSMCKNSGTLPMSHSLSELSCVNESCRTIAQLEASATSLYNMCMESPQGGLSDYTDKFLKIK